MIDEKVKSGFRGRDIFFLVFIATAGLIAVWSYFYLDGQIFQLLSQHPNNWNRNFWLVAVAYLGKIWLPIWLMLIWFLATGKGRPVLIAFLALIMISMTVTPLKMLTQRPRPREVPQAGQAEQVQYLHSHKSFPSGDTASAFAVATVITFFVGWPVASLLLAACAGVAFLRVTCMAHYPSDVFAGAAIGSLAGWLAIQMERKIKSLKPPQAIWNRNLAISAVILIPLIFGISKGLDEFLIFLKTYGLLVIIILLIIKVKKRLKS